KPPWPLTPPWPFQIPRQAKAAVSSRSQPASSRRVVTLLSVCVELQDKSPRPVAHVKYATVSGTQSPTAASRHSVAQREKAQPELMILAQYPWHKPPRSAAGS